MKQIKRVRKRVSPNVQLVAANSLDFLWDLFLKKEYFDFIYLDSYDVDWRSQLPSALHGYLEFNLAARILRPGGLLLIDDTPKTLKYLREVSEDAFSAVIESGDIELKETFGKGGLIQKSPIFKNSGRVISHKYQLLWKKRRINSRQFLTSRILRGKIKSLWWVVDLNH